MSTRPRLTDTQLSRVIEKQLRNWEIARSQRPRVSAESEGETEVADFVTVGNVVGAGGGEVVALLAERLGWPTFHREILSQMAGDDAVRARLYKTMDERDLGWFEMTFRSVTEQEFRRNDYFHRLTEAILCLARQGPAIFVGRSADLILPESKGLRVKLIASLDFCGRRFAEENDVPLDEARSMVERIESERLAFVKNHFRIDPLEPTRFDMLIHTERWSCEQSVELILKGLQIRGLID